MDNTKKESFVKSSKIRDILRNSQTIELPNGVIQELPPFRISADAFSHIIQHLDNYIYQQMLLLKHSIPRKVWGDNQADFRVKTILDRHLDLCKFPKLKQPSLENVLKEVESFKKSRVYF